MNKIENRKALPSMMGFFYICEYLGITPGEFFTDSRLSPGRAREIAEAIARLTPKQAEHLLSVTEDLLELNA